MNTPPTPPNETVTPESLEWLLMGDRVNDDQPSTPAPRTFSEAFGLPAGSFVKHLKESEASGMSPEERSMMPPAANQEKEEKHDGL